MAEGDFTRACRMRWRCGWCLVARSGGDECQRARARGVGCAWRRLFRQLVILADCVKPGFRGDWINWFPGLRRRAIACSRFVLGGWDIRKLTVQTPVVVPVAVLDGGDLDIVGPSPWSAVANEFGFIRRVERFCHRIVIAVVCGPHRGDGVGLSEPLGVAHRSILAEFADGRIPLRRCRRGHRRSGVRREVSRRRVAAQ